MMTPAGQKPTGVSNAAKYLSLIIAGGLVVLAFGALLTSFIPLPWIMDAIVGSRRNDDQLMRGAESLARNFSGIVSKLRICSAVVLLAAIAAALQRIRIQNWI